MVINNYKTPQKLNLNPNPYKWNFSLLDQTINFLLFKFSCFCDFLYHIVLKIILLSINWQDTMSSYTWYIYVFRPKNYSYCMFWLDNCAIHWSIATNLWLQLTKDNWLLIQDIHKLGRRIQLILKKLKIGLKRHV